MNGWNISGDADSPKTGVQKDRANSRQIVRINCLCAAGGTRGFIGESLSPVKRQRKHEMGIGDRLSG